MHVNTSSQTLQAILLQQQQQQQQLQDANSSGNPINGTQNGALQLVQAATNTAALTANAAAAVNGSLGNTLNTFA
jgi:hypothetical protein